MTQELENQYEHRLAVELDRFDRLSEEVETVQQRCEGLLEAQHQEHQWELRAREQVGGRARMATRGGYSTFSRADHQNNKKTKTQQ